MTMIAKEARKGRMVRQDVANDLICRFLISQVLEILTVGLCRDHNWPVISARICLGFRSSLANIKVLKLTVDAQDANDAAKKGETEKLLYV